MITDNSSKYNYQPHLSLPDLSPQVQDDNYLGSLRRAISVPDGLSLLSVPQHDMRRHSSWASTLLITQNPQQENINYQNVNYITDDAYADTGIPLPQPVLDINNNEKMPGMLIYCQQADVVIDIPECDVVDPVNWRNASLPVSSAQILATLQRHGENIALVIGRNLLSVGIPTALREYVAKNVLPVLLKNTPASTSVTLGAIAIAMPIALQLAGIARDFRAGNQTPASLSARLANIVLITGASSALVASGGVALAANALIAAVFIYVPFRDATQYFLQLSDNNQPELNLQVCGKSALVYSGNQILVSEGMTMLAQALEPLLGSALANMLGKAIINTIGESADELTYRGLNAQAQNNPAVSLNLRLRPREEIDYQTAGDQLLNTIAARASLFGSAYSAVNAVPFADIFKSMMIGVALGAGYIPFFYSHPQAPPSTDLEAGQSKR
ncbi:hypothetical protein [Pantoea sp. B65]|uniref:hypothetical protein n=1 Tax=Pantoea sp. B65 TaxID=2813359 RepID=UPI0039B5FF54